MLKKKNHESFLTFPCRTGWHFRLPKGHSSRNRIRFTLQTPTILLRILIMRSVRSVYFPIFSNGIIIIYLGFCIFYYHILISSFFCCFQDIHFSKVYQTAPNVFVSANHSSTGKNLDPMHNSITAWVEVRNL